MKLIKKIVPILSVAAVGAGIVPVALTSCVPNQYSWTYLNKKEPELHFEQLPKQELTTDECLTRYLNKVAGQNKMFVEDIFYTQFKRWKAVLEDGLKYTILSCKFVISNFDVKKIDKNFTSRISYNWTEEISVKESAAVGGEQHTYKMEMRYNNIPVNVHVVTEEGQFKDKACLYLGDTVSTPEQLNLANDKDWSVYFAQYRDNEPMPASDGSKQNGNYNFNNYDSFKFQPETELKAIDSVKAKVFDLRYIHLNYLEQVTIK